MFAVVVGFVFELVVDFDIQGDTGVELEFESRDLVLGLHAPLCSREQNVEQWVAFLGIGDEGFHCGHAVHESGYEVALPLAQPALCHYYDLQHSVKEKIGLENPTELMSFIYIWGIENINILLKKN